MLENTITNGRRITVPQLQKHFTWEYQLMQQLTIMMEIKKLLLEKERVMIQT